MDLINQSLNLVKKIYHHPDLRRKILFTAFIFAIYRFMAHIPAPGVDVNRLSSLFAANQFLNLLNIFAGGTLARFSLVALGISPYITASIIMQLMGMVIPRIKELQKEGESGQAQVNQYTRLLTVPLAVVQSISVVLLLQSQNLIQVGDWFSLLTLVLSIVAGALVIMWLGELISEKGIGNGISMILFAGIVSQIPTAVSQIGLTLSSDQSLTLITLGLLTLAIVGLMVFMNEAVRKVPIQYAKRQRGARIYGGQTTFLPIRVNTSGVMPIIFAISIMMVPAFLGRILMAANNAKLVEIGQKISIWFSSTATVYMVVYFLIVFAFSYLSAIIFFNTDDISDELKKSGAFIPGIRPGKATKKHLDYIVSRITFVGGVFLGFVAILPSLVQRLTEMQSLAIGGTSALIVVAVVLEVAKQVESMLVEQNYDKYR